MMYSEPRVEENDNQTKVRFNVSIDIDGTICLHIQLETSILTEKKGRIEDRQEDEGSSSS
jgi:hypothetical protein